MITISIHDLAGTFAENKDIAQSIRTSVILPALENNTKIILDFSNVEGATQSFVHALISGPFRTYGNTLLDSISFKNCNQVIQTIITIVTEYMQEAE